MQIGKGTIATPLLAGPRWNKKHKFITNCFLGTVVANTHTKHELTNHMMDATGTKASTNNSFVADTPRAG